jgi:glucose-1-phosphate cytidylyltransferase
MVPVDGYPILWHVMKAFAYYGHQDFIVCTGYPVDSVRQYFHELEAMNSDFTVKIG